MLTLYFSCVNATRVEQPASKLSARSAPHLHQATKPVLQDPRGFPEGNEESTEAALGTGAANDTLMLLVKERAGET